MTSIRPLLDWVSEYGGISVESGNRLWFNSMPIPMADYSGYVECQYLSVVPKELLAHSFIVFGALSQLETVVTWTLAANHSHTNVLLTHSGFDLNTETERHLRYVMAGVWPEILGRIDQILAE